MHQKKSEVQIGKESSGVSSDFNPSPPLLFSPRIHQKHQPFPIPSPTHQERKPSLSSLSSPFYPSQSTPQDDLISPTTLLSAPHKRPLVTHNPTSPSGVAKSRTLSALQRYSFSKAPPLFSVSPAAKAAAFRALRRARRLRVHFRLVLLLSLPFFYFLVSQPTHSFLLDFLSAFAFSAALLFSLNLALPRLPSIRLYLARSFPIKLLALRSFPIKLLAASKVSRPPLPVFWSIGSRPKSEKRANSGCWVQVYSNGDVYEGEFHKGRCSGSGVYYYYMSGRYEGDWIDGRYDGHGIESWARGSRYRGQYRQGSRHGFGVYRFYTGDSYAGEWFNGQSHGIGVQTCSDGSCYIGEFKCGVKHGLGCYHFRNGDRYAGEYFGDKVHGFGVYHFANGHCYEGSWHEGRKQGYGMYTFRNGEKRCGEWDGGTLKHPLHPLTDAVLRAVQAARRTSENAIHLRRVDEQVNKAVMGANKAATAARVAAVKAVQNRMDDRFCDTYNNQSSPSSYKVGKPVHRDPPFFMSKVTSFAWNV